jgi:tryptophan synthase alpha subunit
MLKELGADGIIVGSGIVRRQDDGLPSVRDFVSSLKGAC